MKICASSHCQGNLQFEERLIIVTIDSFLLKMGRTLFLKYLKTFMVMTPFNNCFPAGMYLRIEMRYMPTGSVVQVFLQNVTCCSSLCYF